MSFLGRLPIVKKYKNKINEKFIKINNEILQLSNENIELRFKLKKTLNEKINVVFICWRPSVWGSLKTVYEAMKKDNSFNVKIVTIPNKKLLPKLEYSHEIYESEGAEDFWKGDDVISGYNYENGEWFDLRLLKPDYVCLQQPYNVTRTESEKSWEVRKYAKIFYVHYASNFIGNGILENTNPPDFIKDVSLYFNQSQMDYDLIKNYLIKLNNTFTKQFITGFPRYDNLEKYKNCESSLWSLPRNKENFRIIWTPRWCTNEGNCSFFDYKDSIINYCKNNPNIDFVFRPHPQAFSNWIATGELSENEAMEYKQLYEKSVNTQIDETKEYLTTFYSSDCLITDVSSIVAEYFLTGKPIIYCHKIDCFNEFSRKLSEGFYWVRNFMEIQNIIEMLRSGNDPLKEKRQSIIKEAFYLPDNGSGKMIAEIIKKDFYGDIN